MDVWDERMHRLATDAVNSYDPALPCNVCPHTDVKSWLADHSFEEPVSLTIIHFREFIMTTVSTRRRFIEIVPFAGVAFLAACSPKVEPPPAVVDTPAPPPAAATPAPTPPVVQEAAPAAPATASAMPLVEETAAQAMALGYVADNTRADKVKFPAYLAGHQCNTCALYQGKAGDAEGPCPLFPGKHVAAIGWCNSWVKKA
jgi:hypothetical protein